MSTIDIEYFDRQIRTYDLNSITKLNTNSVLIYGLEKGLSTEISKNLILSGIKQIYLYDENKICDNDLETGYLYCKEDIGQPRSQVLTRKLQKINRSTNILSVNNYKKSQDVTILINQSVDKVKEISYYCRNENIKLISIWSKGISGVLFVDAGLNHHVYYETQIIQISNINKSGRVSCLSNHNLQTGDIINFTDLEGSNLKSLDKRWEIIVINKDTLQLNNFDISEDFIFINGKLTFTKKDLLLNHNQFNTFHDDKLINTYLEMFSNNLIDNIPKIWTDEIDLFMLNNKISIPEQAKLFNYELIPIVSLFGSIVSSETIKLITNRFTPISQWFSWSDEILIPNKKPIEYIDSKTSYGMIYGIDIENKLMNSEWLIAGFGSIGCEHLKNLAYMNIKNITITDNDIIEKSNLNNQFLFNDTHIGKYKSEICTQVIKELKSDLNIKYYLNRLESDNVDLTDLLLPKMTGILCSVDNINSRKFIDDQCFKYGIHLFDSGVDGNKGSVQPVIPFITETYSASNDVDNDKSYPQCVIKNFPNDIHHTIKWAFEQFEFFTKAPNLMNKWCINSLFLDTLEENEKIIALEYINFFTVKYPTQIYGLSSCILWAVDMFNEFYCKSINKLLDTFPQDNISSDGVRFWSAGKRCPKPIIFDYTNKVHMDFIETTVHLLAKCSGISDDFSLSDIFNELLNLNNNNISLNEKLYFKPIYISQEFNYNNDTNWHVKWINVASNMRALNYSIPTSDIFETKGIVGKIIPKIISTSSAISGITLLEVLKHILDYKNIEDYKSTFINLSEPLIVYSEPKKAPMIDIAGVQINSWTKFDYLKDTTLEEFKLHYEKIFKTSINMIVIDTSMIYADFLDISVLNKKLSQIILEHFNTSIIPNNVSINLLSNDDIEIPIISIKL